MLDGHSAAVSEEGAVADAEFVALGVAAEVVVIVEEEDAGLFAGALAIEVGGCETADAGADDDEIVGFPGGFGLAGGPA